MRAENIFQYFVYKRGSYNLHRAYRNAIHTLYNLQFYMIRLLLCKLYKYAYFDYLKTVHGGVDDATHPPRIMRASQKHMSQYTPPIARARTRLFWCICEILACISKVPCVN